MRSQNELRRIIIGLVAMTLLAWATQILCSQWAFGDALSEKFVPRRDGVRPAVVELRNEAVVLGNELRLKQVVRWAEEDKASMAQTADLVIARYADGKGIEAIDIDQLRSMLERAGVNVSAINFRGSLECRVTWADPALREATERQFGGANANSAPIQPRARTIGVSQSIGSDVIQPREYRTLREILVAEAAQRLNIPADSLDVRFRPEDERYVNLREPNFEFQIQPPRRRNLGANDWGVTIVAAGGKEKANIEATIRTWQDQIFAAKPIASRQVILEGDITSQRILVDRLSDDLPLSKEQIVGQEAARDINAGVMISTRQIEPVQLVGLGEFIDVYVVRGNITIKWVAEAREAGSMGQTIRVRRPGTRDEFSVVLTGPAQAKLVSSPSSALKVAAAR